MRLLCGLMPMALSACAATEVGDLSLPSPEGMSTLVLSLEDTGGEDALLVRAVVANLKTGAGMNGVEELLASETARPPHAHMTALYFAAIPEELGQSSSGGELVQAATGQPGKPIPPFDRAFRMRIQGDFSTPWRTQASHIGALASVEIPAQCIDADGDDYGEYCTAGPDCNDANRETNPAALEICNASDDDCDGTVDEDFDLGGICFVESSTQALWRSGLTECEATGSTVCIPSPGSVPFSCDDGTVTEPEGCCPSGPIQQCVKSCDIDPVMQTHTCTAAATVAFAPDDRALGLIDLDGHAGLEITLQICGVDGWSFHLTDSPTGDGGGADGGTYSNDAELQIYQRTLTFFGNDYTPPGERTLLVVEDFVPLNECVTRTIRIRDQRLQSIDPCADLPSPYGFRINPERDDEGPLNAIWYFALNRVYARPSRHGTGLVSAQLCVFD